MVVCINLTKCRLQFTASIADCGTLAAIWVSMMPGRTALQRIPCLNKVIMHAKSLCCKTSCLSITNILSQFPGTGKSHTDNSALWSCVVHRYTTCLQEMPWSTTYILIRDTAKPGLWTGLVTTITNQLACIQATLGAGRAYTPGMAMARVVKVTLLMCINNEVWLDWVATTVDCYRMVVERIYSSEVYGPGCRLCLN